MLYLSITPTTRLNLVRQFLWKEAEVWLPPACQPLGAVTYSRYEVAATPRPYFLLPSLPRLSRWMSSVWRNSRYRNLLCPATKIRVRRMLYCTVQQTQPASYWLAKQQVVSVLFSQSERHILYIAKKDSFMLCPKYAFLQSPTGTF